MNAIKMKIFLILLLATTKAFAYSDIECKKSIDDFELLSESVEITEISKNIIDIAKRLDDLKTNSNTDFFIAGIYGNYISNSAFYLSYAIKLSKLVDKAKLNSINNEELFKSRVTPFARSFDTAIETVSNHYVVEKNAAARDELGKLKRKLEVLSKKYSSCK